MNTVTVGMIHTGNGTLVFDDEEGLLDGIHKLLRQEAAIKFTVQKSQMTIEQRDSLHYLEELKKG